MHFWEVCRKIYRISQKSDWNTDIWVLFLIWNKFFYVLKFRSLHHHQRHLLNQKIHDTTTATPKDWQKRITVMSYKTFLFLLSLSHLHPVRCLEYVHSWKRGKLPIDIFASCQSNIVSREKSTYTFVIHISIKHRQYS